MSRKMSFWLVKIRFVKKAAVLLDRKKMELWSPPPFEVRDLSGFSTERVESIAVAEKGSKIFVGSADGVLDVYECQGDTARPELVKIPGARFTSRDKVICSRFSYRYSWQNHCYYSSCLC